MRNGIVVLCVPFSLLVRIVHHSLVFLRKGTHDDAVRFFHHAVHVLFTLAFRIDRVVDGHGERMPLRPFTCTRQYIERTIQRDGHDWQLQLVGQLEGSTLEVSHVSGEAS